MSGTAKNLSEFSPEEKKQITDAVKEMVWAKTKAKSFTDQIADIRRTTVEKFGISSTVLNQSMNAMFKADWDEQVKIHEATESIVETLRGAPENPEADYEQD